MDKSYVFVVNRATDISLAQILYLCKPRDIKLTVTATPFACQSEFHGIWKKQKSLQRWLTEEDIRELELSFKSDFIMSRNVDQLRSLFASNDKIGIFPGREPFVIKDLCHTNIAISAVRDYFQRFLDLRFLCGSRVNIFLDSRAWVDEKLCGDFNIKNQSIEGYDQNYEYLDEISDSLFFCDPYNSYKKILDNIGKDNIKNKLGVPLDKKVALVSLRRGDDNLTFHKDDDEFFNNTIEAIKDLKSKNFYIIARRRLSIDDVHARRRNSSEIVRFEEFKKYIDLEVSGWSGFPSKIWQVCYISDLMLLSDMSGICRREGAVCETPMLLPKHDIETYNKNLNDPNGFDPPMKDMHRRGLFSRNVSECLSGAYLKKLREHNDVWHAGDATVFWNLLIR